VRAFPARIEGMGCGLWDPERLCFMRSQPAMVSSKRSLTGGSTAPTPTWQALDEWGTNK